MALKFEVLHASFVADGQEFGGGKHVVDDPSPELVMAVGSGYAAGALLVDEGLDISHVESDEVSLANLDAAKGQWVDAVRDPDSGALIEPGHWDGPWGEGHETNIELGANQVAEIAVDVAPEEN